MYLSGVPASMGPRQISRGGGGCGSLAAYLGSGTSILLQKQVAVRREGNIVHSAVVPFETPHSIAGLRVKEIGELVATASNHFAIWRDSDATLQHLQLFESAEVLQSCVANFGVAQVERVQTGHALQMHQPRGVRHLPVDILGLGIPTDRKEPRLQPQLLPRC